MVKHVGLNKVWPHKDYPPIDIGMLELNRNPENYSQPGNLFRMMNPGRRKVLFGNTARATGDAPKEIRIRHMGKCIKADPAYGEGLAGILGISMSNTSGVYFFLIQIIFWIKNTHFDGKIESP